MGIKIDNINFTDISRIGRGSSFSNVKTAGISTGEDLQDYIEAGEEYRNIQSVLIDWNGAYLGEIAGTMYGDNGYIYTTKLFQKVA